MKKKKKNLTDRRRTKNRTIKKNKNKNTQNPNQTHGSLIYGSGLILFLGLSSVSLYLIYGLGLDFWALEISSL